MRYCVRYRVEEKNWVVADTANENQVLGVHATKAEAYAHALKAQQNWPRDQEGDHLKRVRETMARTLVVERKDPRDLVARTTQ
jgi:hypothetical protein